MPTFGSLFAGIGGIDLGLERAGWTGRWQVEWDAYCQRVLAKHWPDIPRYGDITTVDWSGVERVDLIAGGFPCQPFSLAGQRRGKSDDRWLWPAFADAIRALRPRYVLVENVPGLLAGHGGMGAVLGDLAELGYDAEWDSIPASAVGAPHLRYRVWILAYATDSSRPDWPGVFGGEALGGGLIGPSGGAGGRDHAARVRRQVDQRPPSERDQVLANAKSIRGGALGSPFDGAWWPDGAGRGGPALANTAGDGRESRRAGDASQGAERRQSDRGGQSEPLGDPDGASEDAHAEGRGPRRAASEPGWWLTEPDVGRVAHGVPARVDRLRALGNAVVPQVVEVIGRQLLEAAA